MKRILAAFAALCLLSACDQGPGGNAPAFSDQPAHVGTKPVYLFGVHPLHNPQLLFERYQPLVAFLNQKLGDVEFKLEASRDYPSYDQKLFNGHFQFALPNPYETTEAIDRGYRVFAKMGKDDDFRGIFLVRRDSGIEKVTDLKGKAVSYPAPSALAATMLPQWFLKQHGLDVFRDIDNRYVGSQESSILNVLQGKVSAGATWPPPWRAFQREHPEQAAQLELKWETQNLPNNSLVARKDMPEALVLRVRDLLVHLQDHAEGRAILAKMENPYFVVADNAAYDPVRAFIARFRAEVREPRAEQ